MFFMVFAVLFGGCSRDHLDPTQIGRFRPTPTVNIILDSLGVAEEASPIYEGAEEPRPADVIAYESDYVLGQGDVVRVIIFELLQENQAYVNDFQVNESGNISIPEIGHIHAGKLTELELEDEIKEILSPTILKNPSVTVTLQQSQSRVFTILGDGVAKPNRYGIPRYNFRLMDALAVAGSARQHNVSYIYIIRQVTGEEPLPEQVPLLEEGEPEIKLKSVEPVPVKPENEMLEIIAPYAGGRSKENSLIMTSAEMGGVDELEELMAPEGFENADVPAKRTSVAMPEYTEATVQIPAAEEAVNIPATPAEQDGNVEWIFEDGQWVPVRTRGKQVVREQPEYGQKKPVISTKEQIPDDYGWEQIGMAGAATRVIKVPADKLYGSDPRYNIIIKPGDTISVRLDIVGEFYVHGNVNRVGVYNLTGRPMTLKMAIATAGGLGQLAWPKKCELARRVEEKKEEIVMVDLEKIANGTQPDFFIKQNDWINVGTHGTSRWLAVLRNAFRATYGFGFIYDRNFADVDFGKDWTKPTEYIGL